VDLWERHDRLWRDPADVVGFVGAAAVEPDLLAWHETGDWWGWLQECAVTLLVSREYEHLLLALAAPDGAPDVTFLPMPHPCGIAVDHTRAVVHVAATRNPNQVLDLQVSGTPMPRSDAVEHDVPETTLVPVRSRYYPGSLYIHDLAMIDGQLHACAVGLNSIVALPDAGGFEPVWWPRSVETDGVPDVTANHLQLNSIAAGSTVNDSWYSASTDRPGALRPGHPEFPVDGRGVIFDGVTREPLHKGLTRPHSARWHDGHLYVDNSGYGQLMRFSQDEALVIADLPGWTRGLCFVDGYALVGTSRVIPRFRQYAPGLHVASSQCGLHAVDLTSGDIVASLVWPSGNQIFAIEALPSGFTAGLPGRMRDARIDPGASGFYYSFTTKEAP
jgi:uncharacterized protein (TIGR03032 family)